MNSYIYEFKDLPSTDVPYNAETFTAMQNKLLDSIYPIGSIIIKDDATDYSSYLGFSWEKVFAGVTLVGLDTTQTEFNEIGKTGGEKAHKLTVEELASHTHEQRSYSKGFNAGVSIPSRKAYAKSFDDSAGSWAFNGTGSPIDGGEIVYMADTVNSGGNQPHNNLQPYKVVAYWKRVA